MKKQRKWTALGRRSMAFLLAAVMVMGCWTPGYAAEEELVAEELVQETAPDTSAPVESTEPAQEEPAQVPAEEPEEEPAEQKKTSAVADILKKVSGVVDLPKEEIETTVELTEEERKEEEALVAEEETGKLSGEVKADAVKAATVADETLKETVTQDGLNIHLFDYGGGLYDAEYDSAGNQIFPLIFMGCGYVRGSWQDSASMYLDVLAMDYPATFPTIYSLWSTYLGDDGYPFVTPKNTTTGKYYTASLEKYFDKAQTAATKTPYDQSYIGKRWIGPDGSRSGYHSTTYDVLHYPVSGGLFSKEGNYFVFNSRNNHAYYDYTTRELKVAENYAISPGYNVDGRYTETGHFLPFAGKASQYDSTVLQVRPKQEATYNYNNANYPQNIDYIETTADILYAFELPTLGQLQDYETVVKNKVDMYLGASVDFAFNQPKGGQLLKAGSTSEYEDMIFEFSGDDVMVVYIDGIKVLDLAWAPDVGLGGSKYATINFNTGIVRVYMVDCTPDAHGAAANKGILYTEKTIRECFQAAKDAGADIDMDYYFEKGSNTFKDYLTLDFDMFYMDTGASTSNLLLKFNMDPLPENTLTVAKDVKNDPKATEFEFQVELADNNGVALDEVDYFINGVKQADPMDLTDGVGTFYLGDGDYYTFDLKTNYSYKVTEVDANKNGYDTTVTGATEGKLNDKDSVYVAFTNDLQPAAIKTDKTVAEGDELGKYVLTLEAYTEGQVTQIANVKPADIVMVVDQSGSMLQKQSNTILTSADLKNNAEAQQNASHGLYYLAYGGSSVNFLIYKDGKWYRHETGLNKTGSMTQGGVTGGWDNFVADYDTVMANLTEMDDNHWDIFDKNEGIFQTRYGAAYDAMMEFVNDLHSKGVEHNIAVVGFGGHDETGTALYTGDSSVQYKSLNATHYAGAFENVATDDGYASIQASINRLHTNQQQTHADAGLDIAMNIYENNPIDPVGSRDRITILFSDGATEHVQEGYNYADEIKGYYGATIYTVGTASADSTFMSKASSNYPDGAAGEQDSSKYYFAASGAAELKNAFNTIMNEVSGSNIVLDETAVLRDTISEHFKLPQAMKDELAVATTDEAKTAVIKKYIKVYTAACTGKSGDDFTFGSRTEVTDSMTITLDTAEGGLDVVNVSGFDYAENHVAITDGVAKGKKLIVTIPIEVSDTNEGGNKQPTNADEKTGIYDGVKKVEDFPLPHVDTPVKVTIKKVVEGLSNEWAYGFLVTGRQFTNESGKYYNNVDDTTVGNSNYLDAFTEDLTNAVLTLSHEQSEVEYYLLAGTKLTIAEEFVADGYRVYVTTDGEAPAAEDEVPLVGEFYTIDVETPVNNMQIIITNVEPSTLTISKTVTGNMGDWGKEFQFTVNVNGAEQFFTLKHGESKKLTGIPKEAQIVVTEVTDGYTASAALTGGTAVFTETAEDYTAEFKVDTVGNYNLAYTNDKTAEVDTGVFLDSAPYIVILAAVVAGAAWLVLRRRNSHEE